MHWEDPEGWDGEGGGRREAGLGWGTHVNPWLIHVSVWQKPLQYCKVISLQLIKINEKKKEEERNLMMSFLGFPGGASGKESTCLCRKTQETDPG